MKKRIISALLVGCMMTGCLFAGCGNGNTQNAESSGAENETEKAAETEAAGTENAGTESEEAENGVTALALMQEYNTGELNVIDDNYRTYYEMFVYSFYDSDGDGIGDLNGAIQKLDYLNDGDDSTDTDLGINGIWLMPIMPSTTYHKYDVTDYCNIDAEYGTLDDFKAFIDACHERGINVTIDLIMNHSSSQHEWFQTAYKYIQSLPEGAEPDVNECPYVDYYHFSKEKGSGYYAVSGTEWYYEGQFWSEMPDLNLGNEAVRAEFEAIVDFWLELGVDDFRLDAAKEYYTGADEKNIEVLTWFNDMVKSKKEDTFIVAEVWNDMSVYTKYYASGVSCFDFSFADSTGVIANTIKRAGSADASSYGRQIAALQDVLAAQNPDYIDAPFYTNHDMARGAGYYSGDYSPNQTKMGQAMNLLMSGSAFLYYGEELGMKGSGKDENKRAPMYWSMDSSAEGMCNGPKDIDNVKMKYESLEEQQEDGNSIYHFVKQTIALRNQYPAIARGTAVFEEAISDENICALRKTYEEEEVILIFNISETAQTVDVSAVGENLSIGGVLLTGTEAAALDGTTLSMPAYSVVVLK